VLVDGPFAAEMELIDVAKNAPPFGSDVESVDMMDLHCPALAGHIQRVKVTQDNRRQAKANKLG
jgi:hypothetical protein